MMMTLMLEEATASALVWYTSEKKKRVFPDKIEEEEEGEIQYDDGVSFSMKFSSNDDELT